MQPSGEVRHSRIPTFARGVLFLAVSVGCSISVGMTIHTFFPSQSSALYSQIVKVFSSIGWFGEPYRFHWGITVYNLIIFSIPCAAAFLVLTSTSDWKKFDRFSVRKLAIAVPVAVGVIAFVAWCTILIQYAITMILPVGVTENLPFKWPYFYISLMLSIPNSLLAYGLFQGIAVLSRRFTPEIIASASDGCAPDA